nr:ATP-binding protein [Micromonospora sp. DSM 115978]
SDTGVGIPADELDKLFTRFFRASTATTHAIQGTGLGLSIVDEIVRRHHGTVDITSTEGEGSTVTVRLPLTDADEAADSVLG